MFEKEEMKEAFTGALWASTANWEDISEEGQTRLREVVSKLIEEGLVEREPLCLELDESAMIGLGLVGERYRQIKNAVLIKKNYFLKKNSLLKEDSNGYA